MIRLTAEHLREAMYHPNPLGEFQLSLRGHGFTSLDPAALAAYSSPVDCLDLTNNALGEGSHNAQDVASGILDQLGWTVPQKMLQRALDGGSKDEGCPNWKRTPRARKSIVTHELQPNSRLSTLLLSNNKILQLLSSRLELSFASWWVVQQRQAQSSDTSFNNGGGTDKQNNVRGIHVGLSLCRYLGTGDPLANLHTIVCHNNALCQLEELVPLALCPSLLRVSFLGCPVRDMNHDVYRSFLIYICQPELKLIDFNKVRLSERQAVQEERLNSQINEQREVCTEGKFAAAELLSQHLVTLDRVKSILKKAAALFQSTVVDRQEQQQATRTLLVQVETRRSVDPLLSESSLSRRYQVGEEEGVNKEMDNGGRTRKRGRTSTAVRILSSGEGAMNGVVVDDEHFDFDAAFEELQGRIVDADTLEAAAAIEDDMSRLHERRKRLSIKNSMKGL